jgi:hypothetical protein
MVMVLSKFVPASTSGASEVIDDLLRGFEDGQHGFRAAEELQSAAVGPMPIGIFPEQILIE